MTATRRSFLGRCLAGAVLSASRWLPMAEPVAVEDLNVSIKRLISQRERLLLRLAEAEAAEAIHKHMTGFWPQEVIALLRKP